MELGKLLIELRKEKGIYQKELAVYLNVSIGTISNYENGVHNPDPETLVMLAEFFGVSTDYLLGRTKFRYNLDNLNERITADYTIGDIVNTTLEMDERNRTSLMDYIELLMLRMKKNSENVKTENDTITSELEEELYEEDEEAFEETENE